VTGLSISADQLALEREMADLGLERYRSTNDRALSMGRFTVTTPGRKLVTGAVERTAPEVIAWMKAAAEKPGPRAQALRILEELDPYSACAVAMQTIVDCAAMGLQRASTINKVATMLADELILSSLRKDHHPLFERLNTNKVPNYQRSRVAGRWAKRGLWDYKRPPRPDQVQAALVLTELCLEHAGMFRVESGVNGKRTVMFILLTEETMKWIGRCHDANEMLSPVYLPMIQEPADWGPDQPGGYRSDLARRKPLCRVQRKGHVEMLQHAEMPDVYRAVNALQAVPWRVNPTVYEVARELWDGNAQVAGLPDRDAPEFPERPADDTPELRQWKQSKAAALEKFDDEGSSRLRHTRTIGLAQRFLGKTIYYPHFLDFRGRVYPTPHWLNHQGPDFARGLMSFDRSSRVERGSPEAERWVEYGEDLFGDTIPEGLVEATFEDPLACLAWGRAKKPWQFLGWALDHGAWLDDEGHPIRTVVHADGSNNGLQLYALLLRDSELAAMTNVTPGEKQDIYQRIADAAWAKVLADPDDVPRKWRALLPKGLPRDAVKRLVMAAPYGIRKHTAVKYLRHWLLAYQEEVAQFPWGKDSYAPCIYLAELVWAEVQATIQVANGCMDWLRDVADRAGAVRWTSPSGFPTAQDYPKDTRKQVKAVVADSVKHVRYREDLGLTCRRQQLDGLPPNFIHSLDSAALMLTVCRAVDEGINDFAMIHDSYGFAAGDAVRGGQVLRQVFSEMFSGNLLEDFRQEVSLFSGTELPPPPEQGDLDPSLVLESKHFFN